jgi:magnesium transporter
MPRFINKYKQKVGLPPGTLIHLGPERKDRSRISVIDFTEHEITETSPGNAEECFPFRDTSTITWINVDGVHETEVIDALGRHFGLHPLVMADIVNTRQRPKIEDYDDYLFVVLKMIFQPENGSIITGEQVSLIIGSNYVISFQETREDVFNPVRNRLKTSGGRIRKMGADYLAYALIDTIVDHYFVVLESLGEKMEDLEEQLLRYPTEQTMQAIHSMKRDMIYLRRSVWPLREVMGTLERGESKLIHKATRVYLRDIYDHTIQVIDTLETSRDILSGMLDIYLSGMSYRMNTVMKVLTIIATIFMPLTFIAGVYGMNFVNMPELEWYWGYPMVMLFMATIAFGMLAYFKRKKWL